MNSKIIFLETGNTQMNVYTHTHTPIFTCNDTAIDTKEIQHRAHRQSGTNERVLQARKSKYVCKWEKVRGRRDKTG